MIVVDEGNKFSPSHSVSAQYAFNEANSMHSIQRRNSCKFILFLLIEIDSGITASGFSSPSPPVKRNSIASPSINSPRQTHLTDYSQAKIQLFDTLSLDRNIDAFGMHLLTFFTGILGARVSGTLMTILL